MTLEQADQGHCQPVTNNNSYGKMSSCSLLYSGKSFPSGQQMEKLTGRRCSFSWTASLLRWNKYFSENWVKIDDNVSYFQPGPYIFLSAIHFFFQSFLHHLILSQPSSCLQYHPSHSTDAVCIPSFVTSWSLFHSFYQILLLALHLFLFHLFFNVSQFFASLHIFKFIWFSALKCCIDGCPSISPTE